MHDNCPLIFWMTRSTRLIALWVFAGTYIGWILFSEQNFSNLLPFEHLAWSNLIVLGTPLLYRYVFRNLITFGLEARYIISVLGYFEYRCMPVKKFCSTHFSKIIGPPKSVWSSSFGSVQLGNLDYLQCGLTDFKILTISVQASYSLAYASMSRWKNGHHIFWAKDSIAKLPGWVETSNTAY